MRKQLSRITLDRQWRVAARAMMAGSTPYTAMQLSGMAKQTFYDRLTRLKRQRELVAGK